MKKILAFMLVIVMAFSLAACGGSGSSEKTVKTLEGTVGTPDEFGLVEVASTSDEATNDEATTPEKKYNNNIKGLCAYLKDKNCVFDIADAIVATASLIGADEGYKFVYEFEGGSIDLEVYSYSDKENQWYKQAVAEGKVTLSDEVENSTFEATVSENGKYLLVYNDSKNREDREEAVLAVFNSFHAKAK